MVSKKKDQGNQNLEAVESALSRTELFIEDNSKMVTYIAIGLIVIVAGFIGVKKLIIAPQEVEARAQMFMAEQYFEKDSFNLALNGDGNYLGFLDILDEYKITKSANLAKYYSGISYLHLGQFEDAIEYLGKFKSKDKMISPMARGAMGDAYSELEQDDEAVIHYIKAAQDGKNEFTSPIFFMKAAATLEKQMHFDRALKNYQKIKDDYPDSNEARQIDKYISRVQKELNK
ncbi:MAG: tetratricopeptide repeat protein [Bacteroidetes bacterium]|jgi:tetratricopeptide (TPR) repeat protein|nr:tetratricopeptide repeat protein [Bacteroidota bacterium]MBT3750668.1 tetratricopeptide repeat protein [Bacteroidota bacterium]MBT4399141.1 tetratricopeptide repeat protein [Bacteroidota bacterium]MBT4409392.1 tetratricopeptide repeat protein [Bacteroidota bacterium]MBT7092505.1 tetratricopeptide repeat protein [Bacteroidota bacterium]